MTTRDDGKAIPGAGIAEVVVGKFDDRLTALRQLTGRGRRADRHRTGANGASAGSTMRGQPRGIAHPFDAVGRIGRRASDSRRASAGRSRPVMVTCTVVAARRR